MNFAAVNPEPVRVRQLVGTCRYICTRPSGYKLAGRLKVSTPIYVEFAKTNEATLGFCFMDGRSSAASNERGGGRQLRGLRVSLVATVAQP